MKQGDPKVSHGYAAGISFFKTTRHSMRARPFPWTASPWTASALAALAVLIGVSLTHSAKAACDLVPEQSRTVAKVPTADTLILDDGTEVVLIGALPPVSPNTSAAAWPPGETSRTALEALTSGKSVGLAFSGRRRDRYGRHLAHVFIEQGGERIWVQAHLIATGHARAYAIPGSTSCLADLIDHERSARVTKSGHWATGIFNDQDAHDPRTLSRLHGTFQTIKGRVDHVAKIHGQTVLDFSPDYHTSFSVWIPARAGTHRKDTASPTNWTGKHIRVRGWIEHRRAPRLTINSLTEIELLDQPAAETASPAHE
jgi:micrococcal nuclease